MRDAALGAILTLVSTAALSGTGAEICFIQRVAPSERAGQPAVKVFAPGSPVTITRRDGRVETYVPELARSHYFGQLSERQLAGGEPLPPMPEDAKRPDRFTLADGDRAHGARRHDACNFSARVVDGVLGVEAQATHCRLGECNSVTRFIVPQPTCNIDRVARLDGGRVKASQPGLLIQANWPKVDIRRRDGTLVTHTYDAAQAQYLEALRQMKPDEPMPSKPEDAKTPRRFQLLEGDEARATLDSYSCVFTATRQGGVLGVRVQESFCPSDSCRSEPTFIAPQTNAP